MRGSRPLAGGPYSGTLAYDLVVRIRRRVRRERPSRERARLPEEDRIVRRRAVLLLAYRIEAPEGALVTAFEGAPEPACLGLDACGLHGTQTLRLAPRGDDRTVVLSATGPRALLRGRRRTAVLAPLRAGRLRFDQATSTTFLDGTLTVESRRGDAPACVDERPVTPVLGFAGSAGGARLALGGGLSSASESGRTHCPGPGLAGAGAGGAIAATTVPLAALGQRELAVQLRPVAGLASGWAFAPSQPLRLRLRLEALRVLTAPEAFG